MLGISQHDVQRTSYGDGLGSKRYHNVRCTCCVSLDFKRRNYQESGIRMCRLRFGMIPTSIPDSYKRCEIWVSIAVANIVLLA